MMLVGLFVPTSVHAAVNDPFQTVCSDSGNAGSTVCQEQNKTQGQTTTSNSLYGPKGIVTITANLLSILIGIIAVVMVMIAGLKFITSQGDSGNIASARNTALYAVIGLIVVALAQSIVIFVLAKIK